MFLSLIVDFIFSAICIILGTLSCGIIALICSVILCWLYEIPIMAKDEEDDEPEPGVDIKTKPHTIYINKHQNRTNSTTSTLYDPSSGTMVILLSIAFGLGFGLCYCIDRYI